MGIHITRRHSHLTACGFTAQLKETTNDARKALALAQKSDDTLTNIQRALSPLSSPVVWIKLTADCADQSWHPGPACRDPRADINFPQFAFELEFFKNSKDAQNMQGDIVPETIKFMVEGTAHLTREGTQVVIAMRTAKSTIYNNGLYARSVVDLIGVPAVVSLETAAPLKPEFIFLTFPNGEYLRDARDIAPAPRTDQTSREYSLKFERTESDYGSF